jgi:peptidoglycan/xylan/chitin deacetylase (PgdA/CDA1 family)
LTSTVLRPLFSLLSPAGPRARLSVLIFHRVLRAPDPLLPGEMDAERFDQVCRWLASWFNVLPLDDAVRRLRGATLPARAAAITFDDGYADNHDVALPILQRHGLSATFFVATGFLDGGRMWNDTVIEAVRRTSAQQWDLDACGLPEVTRLELASLAQRQAAIPQLLNAIKYLEPGRRDAVVAGVARIAAADLPHDLMMSSEHVRRLHQAGMQVGAHTVTHPILARLPAAAARKEVAESKHALEQLLQERVALFAYPNGKPQQDYGREAVDIVAQCGFDAALSTAWGSARQGGDRYQLPRFTPWDRARTRFGLRMLRNLATPGSRVETPQPSARIAA